jgi:hypothetical protein
MFISGSHVNYLFIPDNPVGRVMCMLIKQLTVFLENESGRLAEVTRVLGKAGINISALSIADTTEYGILRLIVNDPVGAAGILKKDGFSVGTAEVIGITIDDSPGSLARVLNTLEENNISIEYMYAFTGSSKAGMANVVIKVEDLNKAVDILMGSGVNIMPPDEAYRP